MQYIVQRVPSRGIAHLKEAIPGLIEVRAMLPIGESPFETMRRAFEAAGEAPHVHLEDDILLCENFCSRLEAVVAEHPDEVVSFFTLKKKIEPGQIFPGRSFMMFQCTYVPAGMSPLFAEHIKKHWNPKRSYKAHIGGIDGMFAEFMRQNKISYRISLPNLVQHRSIVSVLNPSRSKRRQSKWFVFDDTDLSPK